MAIINTPITLPMNQLGIDITTILYDVRLTETIQPQGLYTNVVEATNFGSVSDGKGIINTFKLDLQEVENRETTTKKFDDPRLPKVGQEATVVDTYEFVAVTTENFYTRESYTSENQTNEFVAFMKKLGDDTLMVDMYEKKIRPFFNNTWTNKINLSDWDAAAGADAFGRNQTRLDNAIVLAKFIKDLAIRYQTTQNSFTDKKGVVTILNPNDLRLYVDSTIMTYLDTALSNSYNQDNIRNTLNVADIVQLPSQTGVLPIGDTNPSIWICHKQKVHNILGYRTSRVWQNPQTLRDTIFVHRATGIGKFATHAGHSISLGV